MEKNLCFLNFLVNTPGINRDSPSVRTKTEDMLSQLHTNLLGSMLTCKAAVKTMIQQQRGSIVNVGSIIGVKGNAGQCVYSASKGGLVGFSRALAKEVARKKIRVNVVAPEDWGLGDRDTLEGVSTVTKALSFVFPAKDTETAMLVYLAHDFPQVRPTFDSVNRVGNRIQFHVS